MTQTPEEESSAATKQKEAFPYKVLSCDAGCRYRHGKCGYRQGSEVLQCGGKGQIKVIRCTCARCSCHCQDTAQIRIVEGVRGEGPEMQTVSGTVSVNKKVTPEDATY